MKKITIHQPEHFPYLGFFQKMNESDLFVVLDNVNYRKNYFQNRNKIKNTNGLDDWFTIPVEKNATNKLIKDVEVSSDSNWRRKLLNKLHMNLGLNLKEIYESNSLIDINMKSIKYCMNELKINTPLIKASSLNVSGEKSELLANIVKKLGGDYYISGPSGRDYLDLNYFNNIKVEYFEPKVDNHYSTLYNIAKGLV